MTCPKCNSTSHDVLTTRSPGQTTYVRQQLMPINHNRRARLCRHCGLRFYTIEILESEPGFEAWLTARNMRITPDK